MTIRADRRCRRVRNLIVYLIAVLWFDLDRLVSPLVSIVQPAAAMRIPRLLVLMIVASAPLPVRAEGPTEPASATSVTPRLPSRERGRLSIAVGVNSPLSWFLGDGGHSRGMSVFAGLSKHVAIRANVARHKDPMSLGDALGNEEYQLGRMYDFGLAFVWYPRRLWEGFSLEAGALRRDRDVIRPTDYFEFSEPEVATESTTYAGRAMAGWSWVIARRMFISFAAGLSIGRETGVVTTTLGVPPRGEMPITTRAMRRRQIDGESYLRLGFVFGS